MFISNLSCQYHPKYHPRKFAWPCSRLLDAARVLSGLRVFGHKWWFLGKSPDRGIGKARFHHGVFLCYRIACIIGITKPAKAMRESESSNRRVTFFQACTLTAPNTAWVHHADTKTIFSQTGNNLRRTGFHPSAARHACR